MVRNQFEAMLTGGHPNSLGRTIDVVALILADSGKLKALFRCYLSEDETVRLRTSNALKRICREKPDWLIPYIDKLIDQIANIDQASTQWTLAILFQILGSRMTQKQRAGALKIMQQNLIRQQDWLVRNHTMQTLGEWAKTDAKLKSWLLPQLRRLQADPRKSVAARAGKLHAMLG